VKSNVKAPATPNSSKDRNNGGDSSTSTLAVVACGFCQEAPTFHDPERAGLERHDFHAVLQPLPARLPNNTCDHHVSQVASQASHSMH